MAVLGYAGRLSQKHKEGQGWVQQAKTLAAKPDDLSSIPRLTW